MVNSQQSREPAIQKKAMMNVCWTLIISYPRQMRFWKDNQIFRLVTMDQNYWHRCKPIKPSNRNIKPFQVGIKLALGWGGGLDWCPIDLILLALMSKISRIINIGDFIQKDKQKVDCSFSRLIKVYGVVSSPTLVVTRGSSPFRDRNSLRPCFCFMLFFCLLDFFICHMSRHLNKHPKPSLLH